MKEKTPIKNLLLLPPTAGEANAKLKKYEPFKKIIVSAMHTRDGACAIE
jgi:hypothetical protein